MYIREMFKASYHGCWWKLGMYMLACSSQVWWE